MASANHVIWSESSLDVLAAPLERILGLVPPGETPRA
jgi:hypothetical protein